MLHHDFPPAVTFLPACTMDRQCCVCAALQSGRPESGRAVDAAVVQMWEHGG